MAYLDDQRFLLRRCSGRGAVHRCDVAEVAAAKVLGTRPAFHRSKRPTREQLLEAADELGDLFADHGGRRMSRTSSEDTDALRVHPRSDTRYRYALKDREFEVAYRDTSPAESEMLVARVRFGEDVSVVGVYVDHNHLEQMAVRLRHALGGDDYDDSWLLLTRSGPPLTLRVTPVPGRLGYVGEVVPTSLTKRAVAAPPAPAPPPRPPPPPPPPPAPAAPAPAPLQACEDHGDCPSFHMCLAPEEENTCGRKKKADCPEGHFATHCGQCLRRCSADKDCPQGRCNASDGSGWCISERRCVYTVKRPRIPARGRSQ